ncbi:GNAT family N-acetyltransferase [Vibrio europaeus]|uniref:GNAT family N-acetyltransferase n=1 Tax=Vibrio europaeus TaxID=300876 RepID=UPI002341B618|nr:GNAT family N-acetyltransferase [Vibrio europaeus]MDC5838643.1 GNAT family N-acetyltransferase [Vibrio europaeus]
MKIRHLEEVDHKDLHSIYSFTEVMANTSQLPFLSSTQVSNLFSASNQYTLVAEIDGKVVGHVTLFLTNKVRDKHSASIAIAVHPDSHGQGIGKALMQEAINQADNWLNLIRVELEVHADNNSAKALYEKVGFETEGFKRLSTFKNGRYIDMVLMSRISPMFEMNA